MKEAKKIPRVSIITPSYNQGRFIEETIKSVISQEGDFYIEYIIMDGGSTDGTVEIIDRYDRLIKEKGFPLGCLGVEFEWVSGLDDGQSDAINKGFGKATGEILAWLNADDTYMPGAVAAAAGHLEANPDTMMVYGEGYETDERGGIVRRFPATEPFDLERLINVWDYILQPTVFVRKVALEGAGYLDTSLNWCMDWDLWIRLGKRFRVDYLPEYLACSRVHGQTKTSTGGFKRFAEIRRVMRRYTRRPIPPGYLLYGYDLLISSIAQRSPLASKTLRATVGRIGSFLYRLTLGGTGPDR
jgi:glycosyltransferase involved in cell wall biosynthesis